MYWIHIWIFIMFFEFQHCIQHTFSILWNWVTWLLISRTPACIASPICNSFGILFLVFYFQFFCVWNSSLHSVDVAYNCVMRCTLPCLYCAKFQFISKNKPNSNRATRKVIVCDDTAVPSADYFWYDHVPIHKAKWDFLFLLQRNAIRGVLCFTFDLKINH